MAHCTCLDTAHHSLKYRGDSVKFRPRPCAMNDAPPRKHEDLASRTALRAPISHAYSIVRHMNIRDRATSFMSHMCGISDRIATIASCDLPSMKTLSDCPLSIGRDSARRNALEPRLLELSNTHGEVSALDSTLGRQLEVDAARGGRVVVAILYGETANEAVERHLRQHGADVRHFGEPFDELHFGEFPKQVRDVIHVEAHVVHLEPRRPEGPLNPRVRRHARGGVLACHVEVDSAKEAAWRKERSSVLDGGEPVWDHGQRVRECNHIDLPVALVRHPRRRVVLDDLHIVPAALLAALAGHVEQRAAQVDKIDLGERHDGLIAHHFEVRAGAAAQVTPDATLPVCRFHLRHELFAALEQPLAEGVVVAGL
mmetsp:Transcript_9925/g.25619  ORF Transcript_9925/g.25619 Transcript_9925/m.25619 type:complete len:370 (-) Transcript_9925:138-1247(-)